jgi:hypothetical protein
MHRGCKAGVCAIISALAFASAAAAPANANAHHHYRQTNGFRTYIRGLGHGGIVFAGRVRWAPQGRGLGYVNLVGDPETGLVACVN